MLSHLLFPQHLPTPEELEKRYPPRNLPEKAVVTRFSPSPTGFVTFGALFPTSIGGCLVRQSGGVYYLRIEDTDAKREVADGVQNIIDALAAYGVHFDEGAENTDADEGYGPYRQRARVAFYQTYVKRLYEQGLAYPCFCTEDELNDMRSRQEAEKANFGYHGSWVRCRDLSDEEITRRIEAGIPYVMRLRSPGREDRRITLNDSIRGKLDFPENTIDHVLLKSDGVPTYHLAHAVDDHLMRTTLVLRGDEWLATYPLHHQLFDLLGFDRPGYAHFPLLMKMDGESRRKLSKRKDPELALSYYREKGYSVPAVMEYIMTLLNSNFEDWRRQNPALPLSDFPFSLKKMNAAGALFDERKLEDVSRNVIARMDAGEVYDQAASWLAEYDPGFAALFTRDADYTRRILAIGRGGAKPRKDFTIWQDVAPYCGFFFDEAFQAPETLPSGLSQEEYSRICAAYLPRYSPSHDAECWFAVIKAMAEELGYCPDMKRYKQEPEQWRGSVADVSMALRLAVTGRENAPDLREVMGILGEERVRVRLQNAISR